MQKAMEKALRVYAWQTQCRYDVLEGITPSGERTLGTTTPSGNASVAGTTRSKE